MIEAADLGPVEFVRPLGGGAYEDIDAPDPPTPRAQPQSKDKTAAERQRSYRERKRNAESVTPVTPETVTPETVTRSAVTALEPINREFPIMEAAE